MGVRKIDGENNGENPIFQWMIWGETPLFLETSPYRFQPEISRHWSQEFDFFEFCGARGVEIMGGCEPQFEKKQGSWNDLPITVGGIQKLPDTKMCCKAKVIKTSY